jgi:hypothetical protein
MSKNTYKRLLQRIGLLHWEPTRMGLTALREELKPLPPRESGDLSCIATEIPVS